MADFVQTLTNLRKTGKLSLTRFAETGFIFFRAGRIVSAGSTSMRETLGSLLISRRLITERQLEEALGVQRASKRNRRLGEILVEMSATSGETLRDVVRQQTQQVLSELLRWKQGRFEFEPMDIEEQDEFGDELSELLIPEGMSAERVLSTGSVPIDEPGQLPEDSELVDPEVAGEVPRISSLRDLLLDLRAPEFSGELTGSILRYLSGLAGRYVLFSVRSGWFCGMNYYGPESSEELERAIRQLRIPVGAPSVLSQAASRRRALRGPLRDSASDREIVDCLGGSMPKEVLCIPVVVNGQVMMVLYGDPGPGDAALGPVSELELAMLQVGLAMEKRLLEGQGEPSEQQSPLSVPTLHLEDFRALVETGPEPVVVIDVAARVLYANEAFARIVGRATDEIRGEEIIDAVHPDDAPDLSEIVREVNRGGVPGGQTVRLREADGPWRRCYVMPSPFVSRAGDRCVVLRSLATREIDTRFDPLTGLLDYEPLVHRVERVLERFRMGSERPFAVLFIGMDRFTLVNVRHGWAQGNAALKAVAARLTLNLRPGDIMARAGGDRFCVVLDHLRKAVDAVSMAERITESLGESFPMGEEEVSLSVSIGVATSNGGYESAEEMLDAALTAMATAKTRPGSVFEHARSRLAPVTPSAEQEAALDRQPGVAHIKLGRRVIRAFAFAAALVTVVTLTLWLTPAAVRQTEFQEVGDPAVARESESRMNAVQERSVPVDPVTDAGARPADQSPTTRTAREQATASESVTIPLTLELRAHDDVWVRLSIDGTQRLETVLSAGQSRTFEGVRSAELVIGHAAGITVVWNGNELGSFGRPGQVRRLYFTPTEFGSGSLPRG